MAIQKLNVSLSWLCLGARIVSEDYDEESKEALVDEIWQTLPGNGAFHTAVVDHYQSPPENGATLRSDKVITQMVRTITRDLGMHGVAKRNKDGSADPVQEALIHTYHFTYCYVCFSCPVLLRFFSRAVVSLADLAECAKCFK
jgi:hypothetical protein